MALAQYNHQRLEAALERANLLFDQQEGFIGVGFDEGWFGFDILGESQILRCFGRWFGEAKEPHDIATLRELAAHLNSDSYLFKHYPLELDNGVTVLQFEHCLPITAGISDEQIDSFIDAMFTAGHSVFTNAAKELPSLAPATGEEK
ncbi:YbjN domain-containing protein [Corynebacterium sp. ES2794-CONJ1]|uniref:YbjN domain-containing protein n=1 Tax=unclassified Corynebacterium TaxID=2624378 RepID=UPI002166E08C|nr:MULTISPECIES: YbjN domain-containing protein [unclassified Corynebacterium]MCS4489957.1 YbjN domain-containing protein [Corynebacterium sp. ES2775-CONJ]MCS4491680.1 YbjN domain-containing protein [Corynebacterium sp. ES2715-CONJ3]MCS4531785.1 YbjN domain-containing protein [Corynebacterium sp. ES2730-CONJ]MCU9519181.1 YbjN domain-containing protein [Corynebacterium sp. ES2794-CONJ1]